MHHGDGTRQIPEQADIASVPRPVRSVNDLYPMSSNKCSNLGKRRGARPIRKRFAETAFFGELFGGLPSGRNVEVT